MIFDLEKAIYSPRNISENSLVAMLSTVDRAFEEDLFAAAREVKHRVGRDDVLPRGLIECSNVCMRDCLYCGVRRSNANCRRYRLAEEDVVHAIAEARRRGYPAVAFQAGEIVSEENTRLYERFLAHAKGLEVTLSLGEQSEATYRRWKDAGALRYLLRIESSSPEIFSRIHPPENSFFRRLEAIRTLKRLGYVTGTGVMIGLPGQSVEDLARDILFFAAENVDMVGMGPYIPHPDTPLGAGGLKPRTDAFRLALRMIALTRLYLQDVNIVAATALDALDRANGREKGIAAGANVIMPNLTPLENRRMYDLYPGKAES